MVNVEQEEVEDGTAVKPARGLVVEIGEQHLQRLGHLGGTWSLEQNLDAIRTGVPDDSWELEKTAENAEDILGILVEPIKV